MVQAGARRGKKERTRRLFEEQEETRKEQEAGSRQKGKDGMSLCLHDKRQVSCKS